MALIRTEIQATLRPPKVEVSAPQAAAIGSRVLVDVLFSLQHKKLILYAQTDEHDQHRKLFYLVKTAPSVSDT
jgi:hypothetical protein